MLSWTLGHPRDYFIAGVIVGMLFSAWVAVMVGLFVQTRRNGLAWRAEISRGKSFSRINNRRS